MPRWPSAGTGPCRSRPRFRPAGRCRRRPATTAAACCRALPVARVTAPRAADAGCDAGSWLGLPHERHAHHVGMKDHRLADKALHVADRLAAIDLLALADKHQAVARVHWGTEAHFIQPAEADEIALHQFL